MGIEYEASVEQSLSDAELRQLFSYFRELWTEPARADGVQWDLWLPGVTNPDPVVGDAQVTFGPASVYALFYIATLQQREDVLQALETSLLRLGRQVEFAEL